MVSSVVLTAAPADVEPWPVLASALVEALRAELLLAFAEAVALDVDELVELDVEDIAKTVSAREVVEAAAEVADGEVMATVGLTTVPIVVAGVTIPACAFDNAVPRGVAPEVAT